MLQILPGTHFYNARTYEVFRTKVDQVPKKKYCVFSPIQIVFFQSEVHRVLKLVH